MRVRSRSAGPVTAAAVVFLVVAWLAAPPGVPLYDGIGFPDEPYRFLVPPAGSPHTAPPTDASGRLHASGGRNDDPLDCSSAEQGPQVELAFESAALTGPPDTTGFEVRASPVPDSPTRATPTAAGSAAGPRLDGNIYRVTARALPAGAATFAPGGAGYIVLRATDGREPELVFVYRPAPAADWRTLGTERIGQDIFQARLAGLGEFALAYPAGSSGGASRAAVRSRSPVLTLLLTGGLLALLGAAVLLVRFVRSAPEETAPP